MSVRSNVLRNFRDQHSEHTCVLVLARTDSSSHHCREGQGLEACGCGWVAIPNHPGHCGGPWFQVEEKVSMHWKWHHFVPFLWRSKVLTPSLGVQMRSRAISAGKAVSAVQTMQLGRFVHPCSCCLDLGKEDASCGSVCHLVLCLGRSSVLLGCGNIRHFVLVTSTILSW